MVRVKPNTPFLPKLSFPTFIFFSRVLECHTEGGEGQKPWSPLPTEGRGEGQGMQGRAHIKTKSIPQAESKVMVAIKEVNENELSENGGSPSASPGPHVGPCSFNSPLTLATLQAGAESRVKRDGRPTLVKQKHSIQVSHNRSTYFMTNRLDLK